MKAKLTPEDKISVQEWLEKEIAHIVRGVEAALAQREQLLGTEAALREHLRQLNSFNRVSPELVVRMLEQADRVLDFKAKGAYLELIIRLAALSKSAVEGC